MAKLPSASDMASGRQKVSNPQNPASDKIPRKDIMGRNKKKKK